MEPAVMAAANGACWRRTPKAWSRLARAKATSIVGSDTTRDRLPAVSTSTAYSSVMVGISSSPPATPITAATTPIPNPAAIPARARPPAAGAGRQRCARGSTAVRRPSRLTCPAPSPAPMITSTGIGH
jgi:hypothetical protein